MGSKILSYGETGIIKSAFHKKATSININEIVIKVHLSTTLDMGILMDDFHH